jgi:hypothetical protein
MKRFMFLLAMLLVVSLSSALAQSEIPAVVTATVENELILENLDSDWGIFAPGGTYTITPSGYKEPPGPGEAIGDVFDPFGWNVTGNGGTDVLISMILPAAFISDDGNGSIPLSGWTYGWNYVLDNTASFNDYGPITGSAVLLTLGVDGAGLFLGATATVPTTAFAGTYAAQVIGSATYVQ